MSFPNYIIKNIIYSIMYYIYKNDQSLFNIEKRYGYIVNNNETINYSIVCKSWFNIVRECLSNIINFKNYHSLKHLISYQSHQFKLITNVSIQVFFSLKEYEEKLKDSNFNLNLLKKILVYSNPREDSNRLLLHLKEYPKNAKFNITITEDNIFQIQIIKDKYTLENLKINNINSIWMCPVEDFPQSRNELLLSSIKLNPRTIHYDQDFIYEIDYSKLFELSTLKDLSLGQPYWKPNEFALSLSSSINPIYFSNINKEKQSNSLKKLTLSLSHHYILKIMNNQENGNNPNYKSMFEDGWKKMIEFLNYNKNIKHLVIYDICIDECQCQIQNLDLSILSISYKSVFTSSFNSIKVLELGKGMLFIHSIIDGLVENKTIKTLILNDFDFTLAIKQILIKNKIIRNYISRLSNIINDLDGLELLSKEYYNQIDLYSITFYTHSIEKYVDVIKSNSYQIKEFNIIEKLDGSKNQYKQIISNNSLINFIKIKE